LSVIFVIIAVKSQKLNLEQSFRLTFWAQLSRLSIRMCVNVCPKFCIPLRFSFNSSYLFRLYGERWERNQGEWNGCYLLLSGQIAYVGHLHLSQLSCRRPTN